MMNTLRFKTNAKCGGCVAAIGAELGKAIPAGEWSIDLASPDKVLTVNTDLTPNQIIELVEAAGFTAELLD